MLETKKDDNHTKMRTLVELLYSSIAIKEQTLSSKIFLWDLLRYPYWTFDFLHVIGCFSVATLEKQTAV